MPEFQTIQCDWFEPIATLTLMRPQALNALSAAMLNELDTAFERLRSRPGIRVVLLTGSGERAFAAGADIRELLATDAATGAALSRRGQEIFAAIERCRKPVIACINGFAFGGGLELAMACTLRIASETAQLGLPEAKLGLIPGFGGIQRLVRLAGRGAALKMMLTGQPVTAMEAHRIGLVDEVVAPLQLLARSQELAGQIALLAPLAIQAILEAVARQENLGGDAGFLVESELFGRLCGTADKLEGLSAFLDKRHPVWRSQ